MMVFGCLLVLGNIESNVVSAREMSGVFVGVRKVEDEKRRLEVSSVSVNFDKCNTENMDSCSFSAPFEKNSTLEDKRRVPTGPNPLHNR